MSVPVGAKSTKYIRVLHELLCAVFSAILIVTVHEGSGFRWVTRLWLYYASHYRPELLIPMDEVYRLYVIAFALVWGLATEVFICLRMLARFSFTRNLLRTLGGAIAVAGYPLASLYYGEGRILFLEVELAILAVCVVLWAYRRWPVSWPFSIFLLVVHFTLWARFSGFPGVLCCLMFWPGWIWNWSPNSNEKLRLLYPILGFCSTLVWARYFRTSAYSKPISASTEVALG